MTTKELNEKLFDRMMEQAIVENHRKYMATLPSDEELKGAHIFSAKFEKKIAKLIAKNQKTDIFHSLPTQLRKHAVGFVLLLVITSFLAAFSSPIYAAIKEVTLRWFPQFSTYEYNLNAADIKNAEWEFAYIPKGYELSNIHFSGDMVDWEYTNYKKDDILQIFTRKASSGTTAIDNEHSDYSQIELNGVTAELYSSNEAESPSYLLWVQDGYAFHIVSYLDKNELIKIASSLKLKG